jgi:hypothetical protein
LLDSGLPADVLEGKLKKDISFALRRGTIARVTHQALDATLATPPSAPPRMSSSRPSTDERRAGGLGSLGSLLFFLP